MGYIEIMTNTQYHQILSDVNFPKGQYARAVLDGKQRLSGADLRGKARRFGTWYHIQRCRVLAVAAKYGVTESIGSHGLRYIVREV